MVFFELGLYYNPFILLLDACNAKFKKRQHQSSASNERELLITATNKIWETETEQ